MQTMEIKEGQRITQTEAFLKYLEHMDIDMLDLILSESSTYFGASKKVFLKKLSYIFKDIRLAGEKVKIKKDRRKPNTYYLFSKGLLFTNKFIIEEKDGNIIKLVDTRTKRSKEDIEFLGCTEIFFLDDEKKDFKPSNEYLMAVYRCTNAYEELVNDKIQILTKDDISHWIKKHRLLYEEVKEEYLMFKYNDFKSLFLVYETLLEDLQFYNIVKEALELLDDSNPASLLQWVRKYECLMFYSLFGFKNNFEEKDSVNKDLNSIFSPNIYFKGDDFRTILKFIEIYFIHFNALGCIHNIESYDD